MFNLFKKKKKPVAIPTTHKLKVIVKKFVDELENKKNFNEKLYNSILEKSVARNKKEILDDMVKQIQLFEDYDEEEVNFNYIPFLQKLQQEKLDKD